jgi:serine/threonine protein kinase
VDISGDCVSAGDILYNRYEISTLLGKGGMGKVYLAKDLRLEGKLWAIKESRTPIDYQKFIDEAKILASLEHPNLPKIVDYYPPSKEGFSYLVMDYIKGHTLEEIFELQEGIFSYSSIVRYTIQLCDVFHYLHQQPSPIVYRDIKPSNVMIDEEDRVRLIDFGIARNYKEGQELDTVALGTLGFAAPEQYKKQQTDHRADIYSLGAMIFYLLSKGNYYDPEEMPLAHTRPELPTSFVRIIQRMTMEDPQDRYQSALEIRRELEQLGTEPTAEISYKIQNEQASSIKQDLTIGTAVKSAFIAIGSLYSRAGSSLIAGNLANYLSQSRIPTSLVESPTSTSYWYSYFNGEENRPRGWISWAHQLSQNKYIEKRNSWTLKSGLNLVIHDIPISREQWGEENIYKFLIAVKETPIIIHDVSYLWNDVTNKVMLEYADEIWVVIDFDIAHINAAANQLIQLKTKYGNRLKLILNKVTDEKITKLFKHELGEIQGEFPLEVALARTAQWENRLITENMNRLNPLEPVMVKLAARIVDRDLLVGYKPWYKKILKRATSGKVRISGYE